MKLRKFIKNNFKLVIAFTSGLLVAGTGVYAATVIASSQVSYTPPSESEITATTVEGAINQLYTLADNQYFDFATAQASSSGKVFASKKGLCISRNRTVYCLKANNWTVEKEHIQEVFSDVSCNVSSVSTTCRGSDFYCRVFLDGRVVCTDLSNDSYCEVFASGSINCV